MPDKSCYKKINHKAFWLNRDQASACCRAYPIDFKGDLESLIQHWHTEDQLLKQGIEVDSCNHCWLYERKGIQSYREQTKDNLVQNFETIDIDFSNLCNHMCVYCSPKYSSMWEDSIRTQGMFKLISSANRENLTINNEPKYADKNFQLILNYLASRPDQSIILNFLGGEPLMQLRNIEKILEICSTKIAKIEISTNLNPPLNRIMKQFIDNLPNTVDIHLRISMDASPEFNCFSRAGFDQTKFLENLAYVKEKNVQISFTGVCNAVSIFDLKNLINWHDNNGHSYVFNPLNNPDMLQIKYLPLKYRQQIWQSLDGVDTSNFPDFIFQMLHHDDEPDFYQYQCYTYLHQYFERTGINPNTAPNKLFVGWWNETHTKFQSKLQLDI